MKRIKNISAHEYYKRLRLENGVEDQESSSKTKAKEEPQKTPEEKKTERNRRKRERKRQRHLERRSGVEEQKVKNLEPEVKNADDQVKKKKKKKVEVIPEEEEDIGEEEDLGEEEEDIGSMEEEEEEEEDFILEAIDPIVESEALLASMLGPISVADFFKNYWEKKPLVVSRKHSTFYSDWFSTQEIDSILRENRVMFTEHLDVTSYVNGKRETHNPEGRAFPAVVWDFYHTGCSVRMLCPQAFCDSLAFKLNLLQEYFGCFVGSNAYLTPAGTQGFAPHYDDIEAFVLQLEGKKTWRLHNPRNESEKLARTSSRNFSQKEVGPPVMEVTLNAGDLLYFPRGMIHQAMSPDEEYSLHLTVSTNQKNTWGDLFTKLLPLALEEAMAKDVRFRVGLPPGYLRYMGEVKRGGQKRKRAEFCAQAKQLLQDLITKHVPLDAGCDEMGKQLAHDSMPPVLADGEAMLHVSQQGEQWCSELGEVVNAAEISPDTELRLVRASCVRLVRTSGEEDEEGRLFHALTNTKFYHEVEPTFSAVSKEALPCVQKLIKAYPDFVKVEDFPLEQLDEKLSIAIALYDMGLVISREPLTGCDESSSEDESQ